MTDATEALVTAHVPPVEGDNCVVFPIQIPVCPVMETTGLACTVRDAVGKLVQVVELFVKVNVAFPWFKPITIPILFTLATEGLLLVQTPPELGDNVVVEPTHNGLLPMISTTGLGNMVMVTEESDLHPKKELVYTKRTVPCDMPVTVPAFEMDAIEVFELVHVPPVAGKNLVVAPTQICEAPSRSMAGLSKTVTESDPAD